MGKAERIQINCRVDNLAPGKEVYRFGQNGCLARPHRTRNDEQGFRKSLPYRPCAHSAC